MSNDPPNIAGIWTVTKRKALVQLTPNAPVDINNPTKLPDTEWAIQQNGIFVKVSPLKTGFETPVLSDRLAVWQPILMDGKVTHWQLLLAGYQDNTVTFIQVLKTNKCGNPVKLIQHSIESGFSPTNPLQIQAVAKQILIRKENLN